MVRTGIGPDKAPCLKSPSNESEGETMKREFYGGNAYGKLLWYGRYYEYECGTVIPGFYWSNTDGEPIPMKYRCQHKLCKSCGRYMIVSKMRERTLKSIYDDDEQKLAEQVWPDLMARWCLTLTLPGRRSYLRHSSAATQIHFARSATKTFYHMLKSLDYDPAGTCKLEITWSSKNKWWHTHVHLDWVLPGLVRKHSNNRASMLAELIEIAKACGFGERIGKTDYKTNGQYLEPWTNFGAYASKPVLYLEKGIDKIPPAKEQELNQALHGVHPVFFVGDHEWWQMNERVSATMLVDFDEYDGSFGEQELYTPGRVDPTWRPPVMPADVWTEEKDWW